MIKDFIKKHQGLYRVAKVIQNINNSEFKKLLDGYLTNAPSELSLLIHNAEYISKNSPVYLIEYGVKDVCDSGFFALLRHTIKYLPFADSLGLVPIINWGSKTFYYEKALSNKETNVFLYYFMPVSASVSLEETPYIIASQKDFDRFSSTKKISYLVNDKDVRLFGEIYKKYIKLNDEVENYIDENVHKMLLNKKVLGVHIRGTDFSQNWANHPKIVTVDEYLAKSIDIFESGEYDGIFLATDDINALNKFKNEFGGKLLFYDDVFRTENDIGPHETENDRNLHHYKLGLEVLRDAYTLANCKSLVCGLSQVSFAAQYINYALDRSFDTYAVIDHGLNSKKSFKERKAKRMFKKEK